MTVNYVIFLAQFFTGLVLTSGAVLVIFSYFGLGVACLLVGFYSWTVIKKHEPKVAIQ